MAKLIYILKFTSCENLGKLSFIKTEKPLNFGAPSIPLGQPRKYSPLYHKKELFRNPTTKNLLKTMIYLFEEVRKQI